MSVSRSDAGMSVPMFSRSRILFRLRRPHEPLRRPRGRSFPGEVEAGGYGSGRSKKKCSQLVDEKAAKRGGRSDFHSIITRFWITYKYIYTYIYTETGADGLTATLGARIKKRGLSNARRYGNRGDGGSTRRPMDTVCELWEQGGGPRDSIFPVRGINP